MADTTIDSGFGMFGFLILALLFLGNGGGFGWGNGNPGFKEVERPVGELNSLTIKPFSNKAQVIIRSLEGSKKPATVTVAGQRIEIGIL